MGAVRITSNLKPDSKSFTASGQNFAIYVAKKSNNELLIQKNNITSENLYAFEVRNLSLDSNRKPLIMQIPYNLIMAQYDYTMLTYIIYNKNLKYQNTDEVYLSDIVEIKTYYSSSPYSISQIYEIGEIVVENLIEPINLFIPY